MEKSAGSTWLDNGKEKGEENGEEKKRGGGGGEGDRGGWRACIVKGTY